MTDTSDAPHESAVGALAPRTPPPAPPAWLVGAVLALACVLGAASAVCVRHVSGDLEADRRLRMLDAASARIAEALARFEHEPGGRPAELAHRAGELSRAVDEVERLSEDDPTGWIVGSGLDRRDVDDLRGDWRRLQVAVQSVSTRSTNDPARGMAFDVLDAGVPTLRKTVARASADVLEHVTQIARWGLWTGSTAAVLLASGIALLLWGLWARREHERRGRRERVLLAHAVAGSADALAVLDTSFRVVWASEAFASGPGGIPGAASGHGLLPVLAPGVAASEARRVLREALAGGARVEREWTHTDREGRTRRMEIRLCARADRDGEWIVASARDATEHLEAGRHGRERERFFQLAVEVMPDGVVLVAADGRVELCNAGAERIVGVPASQLVGSHLDHWNSLLANEDGTPFPAHESPPELALRDGRVRAGLQMTLRRDDGQVLSLRADLTPITRPRKKREEREVSTEDEEMHHRDAEHLPITREGESTPYAVLCTFSDVTARRLTDQAIRKLTQAVQQSPVPVVITDLHGTIEYVNEQFHKITGYSAEEVLGRNPRVLASGETSRAVYAEMWSALSAGREWRGMVWNRRRCGETFPAALSIFPLRDERGRVTHYVAYHQDMDEARRHEHELREANATAARAMRERAEFLQHLSREMVGPLECITRTSESLLLANVSASAHTGLRRIDRAAEQLLAMIHQLFDLGWLQGSNPRAARVMFRLRALLREVIASLARDARRTGELPSLHVEANVPDALEGDAAALRQLVWALAGQVASGERGPRVEVRVAVTTPAAGRSRLRFEVRRWGATPSPQRRREIERILADPTATAAATTDLGPTLAARLAAHLGGRIEFVTGEEGCDLWSFEVEFGLVATDDVPRPERPEPGHRVLLVDGGAAGEDLLAHLATLGLGVVRGRTHGCARTVPSGGATGRRGRRAPGARAADDALGRARGRRALPATRRLGVPRDAVRRPRPRRSARDRHRPGSGAAPGHPALAARTPAAASRARRGRRRHRDGRGRVADALGLRGDAHPRRFRRTGDGAYDDVRRVGRLLGRGSHRRPRGGRRPRATHRDRRTASRASGARRGDRRRMGRGRRRRVHPGPGDCRCRARRAATAARRAAPRDGRRAAGRRTTATRSLIGAAGQSIPAAFSASRSCASSCRPTSTRATTPSRPTITVSGIEPAWYVSPTPPLRSSSTGTCTPVCLR